MFTYNKHLHRCLTQLTTEQSAASKCLPQLVINTWVLTCYLAILMIRWPVSVHILVTISLCSRAILDSNSAGTWPFSCCKIHNSLSALSLQENPNFKFILWKLVILKQMHDSTFIVTESYGMIIILWYKVPTYLNNFSKNITRWAAQPIHLPLSF